MERLILFFKPLNLRKLLIVFVAGITLLVSTACSNANTAEPRANRPNDISVQAGANNNPYTMGNDTQGKSVPNSQYGNQAYKNQHSDASGTLPWNNLIATSVVEQDRSGLLYKTNEQYQDEQTNPSYSNQERTYQTESIPATRQPSINRTNPKEGILEGIGEQFSEASKFLKEDTRSSIQNAQTRANTGSNDSVARQSEQD
ncbi:MAG: hypothetical protein IGS48_15300 [Oscillatoriales cyanobacterium C42_A2020_001]|nr:hypothetical protein [Leptolyngbyaceae cyanobacterium C42_A2020_001]